MLIDSHCHLNMLNLDKYSGDLDALMLASKEAGLDYCLCVGVDLTHANEVISIAERYDNVFASVGVHPSEKMNIPLKPEELLALASHPKVCAIGETGLDYYYNDSGLDEMRERFRLHIQVAKEVNKPLIIHTRDAREDTMNILREEDAQSAGAVMHCFTETWDMAKQALDLGFYISFSGIVTFKNAKNVVEVAKQVPLDRMLIETDAPYLTPVPFRGKPNEPQYVRYVAEKIAELHNVSIDTVLEKTSTNFLKLFGIAE